MIYRIVSFLIILSMFSCEHDLERTNPLDPESPSYSPPSIEMFLPAGGEELEAGSSTTISWTSVNVDKVNIELVKNGNIHEIIGLDIENTNSYVWKISSNIVNSTYKIRITSANNPEVYDESLFFTILGFSLPGNITIISPTTNDKWYLGDIKYIEWDAVNITGTVRILLYQNGIVTSNPIETSWVHNNSPYSWYIDTTYSAGINYTIKVISDNDTSIYDESPSFELASVEPSITISNLVSDSLEIGQTIDIVWDAINITGTVNIWLFQDGLPAITNPIIETYLSPDNSSYSWYIDTTYSAGINYTIKVFANNANNIFDLSEIFSIVNPNIKQIPFKK